MAKRMTLTVDDELFEQIQDIKRTEFYGDNYATLLRHLITEGLKARRK